MKADEIHIHNGRHITYMGDDYYLLRNWRGVKIFYNGTRDDRNGWHYVITKNDKPVFRWADNHLKDMMAVLENTIELDAVQ